MDDEARTRDEDSGADSRAGDGSSDAAPLNREQRRAARFRPNEGRPDPHAVEGASSPVPDESLARGGDDDGSFAGGHGSDITHTTGAGTGGAVESASRVKHHEGVHLGNDPNS